MGFPGGTRLGVAVAAGVVSCLQFTYVLSICIPGACTYSAFSVCALGPILQIYITKYLDFFFVRVLFGLRIRTFMFVFHVVVLTRMCHTRHRQYQLSRERTYVLVDSLLASESEAGACAFARWGPVGHWGPAFPEMSIFT